MWTSCEPRLFEFRRGFRISVIRRGSEVNLVSELQHLEIFQILTVVLSFLQCDTPQILCPKCVALDM